MERLTSDRGIRSLFAAFALLAALAIATWAAVITYATKGDVRNVTVRQDRIERPPVSELRRRIQIAIDSLTVEQRRELARSLIGSLPKDGLRGQRGRRGARGRPGRDGVDGVRGATGATGARGSRGPIGPAGPKGDQGDTGPPGVSPSVEQIVQQVLGQLCLVLRCPKYKP